MCLQRVLTRSGTLYYSRVQIRKPFLTFSQDEKLWFAVDVHQSSTLCKCMSGLPNIAPIEMLHSHLHECRLLFSKGLGTRQIFDTNCEENSQWFGQSCFICNLMVAMVAFLAVVWVSILHMLLGTFPKTSGDLLTFSVNYFSCTCAFINTCLLHQMFINKVLSWSFKPS